MGLGAFGVSALGAWVMIRIGIKDVPVHRSSHKMPTPRSGGMGIIAGFSTAMLYLYITDAMGYIAFWRLSLLGLGALITVAISLRDDIKAVPFIQKLLVQILTACLIVGSGLSLTEIPIPFFGIIELGSLGGIISVLWIIFFMNVFNFMDGLNGLASGGSLVASLFCAGIALFFQEKAFFYISFSLFFSTLGFFFFNFPKGRIFMGDVGSQFLGLIWAILLLIPAQMGHVTQTRISLFTVPLLFFGFIYDVSATLIRRIWYGDPFWQAHRTHLFQLLNRTGFSHAQVTSLYLCVSVVQGVGAVGLQSLALVWQVLVFIPYLVFMMGYHYWIYSHLARKVRALPKRRRHRS
jgi:UDP-N-acetylmuramyl pentapeptide phosphotransferase/UDP-N-acetylglucosamine-1-phosphate transferase